MVAEVGLQRGHPQASRATQTHGQPETTTPERLQRCGAMNAVADHVGTEGRELSTGSMATAACRK